MITFQMNADAVAAVFLIIITVFALVASAILIGTIASSLSNDIFIDLKTFYTIFHFIGCERII